MSIAGKEAREEYWNEIGLQAVMLRTAYVAGRTAEPCEEQVEAVARILFEESWTHRPAPISFDEFKAMSKDKYTDERIEGFRRRARMILEAARKAVM